MYEAVVMGASAGGLDALRRILSGLDESFPLPIVIVQHMAASSGYLAELLDEACRIRVKEADEKEALAAGVAYLAPAGYHLLVEPERTLSLTVDGKVNFSRPSIDLLFETAADAFGPALIGVVLTGANADGAAGLRKIKAAGGLAIVQDPAEAQARAMPAAAIAAAPVDHVAPLVAIGDLLRRYARREIAHAC